MVNKGTLSGNTMGNIGLKELMQGTQEASRASFEKGSYRVIYGLYMGYLGLINGKENGNYYNGYMSYKCTCKSFS